MQAVIFDVDGTLVDSNRWHIEAWRRAFSHYGKQLELAALHEQMGKGGDQLIPVFCTADEVEQYDAALDSMRSEIFSRDYLPIVQPLQRVRELFELIRARGLRIALASSAKEHELKHHKRKLNIADLVESATSADDAEHSKPCPDIFVAALASLGDVTPNQALVVGDTPYDAQAAAAAGLSTIGVLSGGFSARTLREAGAVAVYTDVAELLAKYEASPLARRTAGFKAS